MKLGVVFLAGLLCGWGGGQCYRAEAAEIGKILKEAKKKSARFERKVRDMVMVQSARVQTEKGEMISETRISRKGDKFRVESAMQMPENEEIPPGMGKIETTIIHDGKETWLFSPLMGRRKLSEREAVKYRSKRDWWDFVTERSEIYKTEKVGERECYVIALKGKETPFTKIWLDEKDMVLRQGEGQGPKGEMVRWLYSDFRKIKGGWEIPYQIEVFVNNKKVSNTTVKSVETNQGISDELFNPSGVEMKRINTGEMIKMMPEGEEGR